MGRRQFLGIARRAPTGDTPVQPNSASERVELEVIRSDQGRPGRDPQRRSYEATRALLASAPSVLDVFEAADEAQRNADFEVQLLEPSTAPDCREGCAWCCHQSVDLSPPEVLLIAQYVRERFSDLDLSALYWRLSSQHQKTRGLSSVEWAARRLDCPLLVDDRCSVYPVRPVACRGTTSSTASGCRQTWSLGLSTTSLPTHQQPRQAVSAVSRGLLEALADLGLDGRALSLTDALRIALENPDAAERWLAGDPIFAEAARGDAPARGHSAA